MKRVFKWIHQFITGASLSFDFTGHHVKRLFPEAFGEGDDTFTSAWKDVGRHLKQALEHH